MSIINDALRKSRRDNPNRPGLEGDDPVAPRMPQRGHDPGQLITLIVISTLVASVVVGLGVFLIMRLTQPVRPIDNPVAEPPAAEAQSVPEIPPTPVPVAPEPAIAVAEVREVPSALEPQPAAGDPSTTEVSPPVAQDGLTDEARILSAAVSYIQGLPVSGVRISDTGRIAMIGKSVYEEGEVINAPLGLRLLEVHSSHLLFEDAYGRRYRRRL